MSAPLRGGVRVVPPSGRAFTPLPIDPLAGFPQTFGVRLEQRSYVFRLYVNADPALVTGRPGFLELPRPDAHLVVKVEREESDGTRRVVLLRKVVPGLEYETEELVLRFDRQRVALLAFNTPGDFGSQVEGGVAPRWA